MRGSGEAIRDGLRASISPAPIGRRALRPSARRMDGKPSETLIKKANNGVFIT
jgi:hypothetical protein